MSPPRQQYLNLTPPTRPIQLPEFDPEMKSIAARFGTRHISGTIVGKHVDSPATQKDEGKPTQTNEQAQRESVQCPEICSINDVYGILKTVANHLGTATAGTQANQIGQVIQTLIDRAQHVEAAKDEYWHSFTERMMNRLLFDQYPNDTKPSSDCLEMVKALADDIRQSPFYLEKQKQDVDRPKLFELLKKLLGEITDKLGAESEAFCDLEQIISLLGPEAQRETNIHHIKHTAELEIPSEVIDGMVKMHKLLAVEAINNELPQA